MYNYVIYHKGCIDGFTSFIILHKSGKINAGAKIYPDVPFAKVPPPDIKGKDVIIMDVAYKYDILKYIFAEAKTVLFIDHHITSHKNVIKLQKEPSPSVTIIYDEHECGASLVWKHLSKEPLPLFVEYVKDNDIALWKMDYTYELIAGLDANYDMSSNPRNIQKWIKLFDAAKLDKIIKDGKFYMKYINKIVEKEARKYSVELFPSQRLYEDFSDFFDKPAQYKVGVFCGACSNIGLIANQITMNSKCDFVIMWTLNLETKEYVLTFRSNYVNVENIAYTLFKGGGHTGAASCGMPMSKYNIADLFFPKSLPRR
jgi:oligoribonuclease NrnB/cAMP/cGMP phosphodiesterase (DHH superfamily)